LYFAAENDLLFKQIKIIVKHIPISEVLKTFMGLYTGIYKTLIQIVTGFTF